ncbi:rubisco accumulation factor 1.1, chloroplastic-like [Magnolia sinica]|uniref:rubisco accumulation factor 1.1, chloroplastic-like n=1 Tax=Magnolia sinica TaxID=86752 RepID=UPI002657E731|nr:rubisco accumulation factor 1.1, chloroplastic-like [Magnolia sinica]
MLSLTPPKPLSLFSNHHHPSPFLNLHSLVLNLHHLRPKPHTLLKPISAAQFPTPPTPSPSDQLYQPFRPPPSPKSPSLTPDTILDILSNRLGLWHQYAPHISTLQRQFAFSPPTIEEVTGISGVEQNRLIVGAQVRDSLISSQLDEETLSFFDIGGAEILYELRLLSASQRAAAARHVAAHRLDPEATEELARAMKDFPRRRGDPGWECFSPVPGDCLAFMYFRQSKEHQTKAERTASLQQAMEVAETERAKLRVSEELWKGEGDGAVDEDAARAARARVPVVRMQTGEVAEATSVVVMPVCEAEEGELGVVGAPECRTVGEFRVVVAEKGWSRWVVLPGWGPVAAIEKGGVVIGFKDGRFLPWKVNMKGYMEEEILVVVNREKKDVAEEEGYYLVVNAEDGGLKVDGGDRLKNKGVNESLGNVVLVVRPPKEDDDLQLIDDDWE